MAAFSGACFFCHLDIADFAGSRQCIFTLKNLVESGCFKSFS
jgi:hypothetical protein